MKKASSKGRGKGGRITAGAVSDQDKMGDFVANAGAFQILSPMRGSPQYWSAAARDLISMIRQLGPCTFFSTPLSSHPLPNYGTVVE